MRAKSKIKFKKLLQEGLANPELADAIFDQFVELNDKYNALLAKLDSDTGVSSTDYVVTSSVENKIKD